MDEERVDLRIPHPEESEKGKRQVQLIFRLNHTMPMTELPGGITLEELPSCDLGRTGGEPPQYYSVSTGSPNRYSWLDEIENIDLLQRLMLLDNDDINLLTSVVFEGHSQREFAQRNARSEKSVSRQFQRIKNFFKKASEKHSPDA